MFKIRDILKASDGRLLSGREGLSVKGISVDSRTIKKGELFVALKGGRFNGRDFVRKALAKGACGAVISGEMDTPVGRHIFIGVRDTRRALGDIAGMHRRRFKIPFIAVTGSNGKTTTKELAAHVLNEKYVVLKNAGTENNIIGVSLALLGLKKNHSAAVIELGMNHHGEIARLAAIVRPDMGLITNIGPSHLEFLKDRKGVLKAKMEMLCGMGTKGTLILNGDEPMLLRVKAICKKITFGLKKDNLFRAGRISADGGLSLILNGRHMIRTGLLGRHNVYNALGAIAIASLMGMELSSITRLLLNFKPPDMRMQPTYKKGINVINDAYNSNPSSLKCAIKTLSEYNSAGKKILVSGDMLELGARSAFFHSQAGRLAARASVDKLIAVGKLSEHTAAAAGKAGMKRRDYWSCSGAAEVSVILKRIARPGDTVLVKASRAMSLERVVRNL